MLAVPPDQWVEEQSLGAVYVRITFMGVFRKWRLLGFASEIQIRIFQGEAGDASSADFRAH